MLSSLPVHTMAAAVSLASRQGEMTFYEDSILRPLTVRRTAPPTTRNNE